MFDPKEEADKLQKALKEKGIDKDTIIEISTNHSNYQRLKIREAYKSQYGTDLIDAFKSEFSGHFKDTLIALYYHPIDFDCLSLRAAMKGLGTDEDTLIEIISTRPNYILKKIKERYPQITEGRDLINDVKSETSGSFRRLLISLLETQRSEKNEPDINGASSSSFKVVKKKGRPRKFKSEQQINIYNKNGKRIANDMNLILIMKILHYHHH